MITDDDKSVLAPDDEVYSSNGVDFVVIQGRVPWIGTLPAPRVGGHDSLAGRPTEVVRDSKS